MLHLSRRSRSTFLFFVLLLLSFPVRAFPPADSLLPSPHFSAIEALESTRSQGTIHIVALMVEFEEEENRFTSGNGTFDLPFLQRDDIIIEPLPHDHNYFEAHLEFAQNYFQTVSGGLLDIEYQVLPGIVQLDNPMGSYSPLGQTGDENYKLAHLARDAWAKAAEMDLPDLSHLNQDRTMFIIFHAGSGRNIELMGTSLNKTPQDIPSVYLGTSSFQRLLDDPGFDGFDIGDSGLRVTNTALLPQTQSRPGEDVTGEEYVLELSINGILTANIGSFLGLPDLFNTESGASAIGRFGLMDGAAIFSYLGMFPPEPSAWEKMHLGWVQPFNIELNTGEPIELPAVSLRRPNSIARHHISADEYFLIENRHRNPADDPESTPLEVTIRTPDGQYLTRHIDPMDDRFDPLNSSDYDEILEPGVVVNVSSFDWSLPGGPDFGADGEAGTDDDRLLNGGMLIWHIDEAVIRREMGNNRVNANTNRRGVQLMEADGAQDIGRPPGQQQDRFTNGHAFDFWWKGNDFTVITARQDSIVVYENRFGPDTQPSNESNTGSPSFFEFYDFSDNIPEAHFFARSLGGVYAQPGEMTFPPLPSPPSFPAESALYPVSPEVFTPDEAISGNRAGSRTGFRRSHADRYDGQSFTGDEQLILPTESGFYTIALNGSESGYAFIDHPSPSTPLIHNGQVTAGQIRTSGATDRQDIASWAYENGSWTQRWSVENQPAGPGFLSLDTGGFIHPDHTSILINPDDGFLPGNELDAAYQLSGEVDGLRARIEDNRFLLTDLFQYDFDSSDRESHRQYTGNLRFSADSAPSFFVLTDNRLALVDDQDSDNWQVHTLYESNHVFWPAFGDWTGDNTLEVFVTDATGNHIQGFNRDGGVLDFFPLRAPEGQRFTGSILLADLTGDGHQELIAAARDSITMHIHAFDRNHNRLDGFPLLAGSLADDTQQTPVPLLISNRHLFSVSPSGEVRTWELPELGDVSWGRMYGPQAGNKVGVTVDDGGRERAEFGILNDRETYNWPNPADDHTYIRFETSEPARVTVTVINASGSTVFEKQADSRGRYPEELRLNTSSWGNGIYFGRIRASNGQGSETKMIKIVITH